MIQQIETALKSYLKAYDRKYKESVFEAMEYSLLAKGKRLRPQLCLCFAKLCGATIEEAMPFACAVEMIHCYSLIHDDLPCMDNDDMRRGKPTNHKVFGEDIALLAGDGLLTMAFEVMLTSQSCAEKIVKAAKNLATHAGVFGMIGGQCIDLQSEGRNLQLDELHAMNIGKTVAIIKSACQMGAIISGADDETVDCAGEYATSLGMAFQIRDDILDVIGEKEELGKNIGMDAVMEKSNFVSFYGVEKAQELVENYTNKAIEALKHFEGDTKFLKELALSMQKRTV